MELNLIVRCSLGMQGGTSNMLIFITVLIIILGYILFSLFFNNGHDGSQNVKKRIQDMRRPTSKEDIVRYESEKLNRPLRERLFGPMVKKIIEVIMKIAPNNLYKVALEKKTLAGSLFPGSAGLFLFLWLSSALGSAVVAGYYFFIHKTNIDFFSAFLYTVCALILGAYLPLLFINILISKRKKLVLKQLPEMLDLICVSVQAGLSFDGALAKVTEHLKGPLVDECQKMLQEIRMGITRRQALINLSERCKLQEISLFTASIIQSDRLGVALSRTLIIQSENMRERRKQNVKAMALKAPVKIIIPLVLFIFPAIFIVALVPSILTMLASFK